MFLAGAMAWLKSSSSELSSTDGCSVMVDRRAFHSRRLVLQRKSSYDRAEFWSMHGTTMSRLHVEPNGSLTGYRDVGQWNAEGRPWSWTKTADTVKSCTCYCYLDWTVFVEAQVASGEHHERPRMTEWGSQTCRQSGTNNQTGVGVKHRHLQMACNLCI